MVGNAWPLDDEADRDAALLERLWASCGDDVLNQCDGQFAAAICDESGLKLLVNWPGGFHDLFYRPADGQV